MKTIKTKEPNEETLEAIKDSREGNNLIEYNNLKEMWKDSEEEEPKTFDCGFKALAWLIENPMREIEYNTDLEKGFWKYLARYNKSNKHEEEVFQYKPIWIGKKRKRKNTEERLWNDDFSTDVHDILDWKNIKVLPKEKE